VLSLDLDCYISDFLVLETLAGFEHISLSTVPPLPAAHVDAVAYHRLS